ncbi:hypothetical protein [Kern Canyon virus]|uniref:Uncharacterized protein n=1 Tax=Kern Canyon virus TaxID=380433 RepID=A0A0D3R1H4_9RHAB|nr:hypothetical protein [Kern Canyon virus]AJR28352.1 hypothetical protein [Kern Canyon virus]
MSVKVSSESGKEMKLLADKATQTKWCCCKRNVGVQVTIRGQRKKKVTFFDEPEEFIYIQGEDGLLHLYEKEQVSIGV